MENENEVVQPQVEQEPAPEIKAEEQVEEPKPAIDNEAEARRQLTARAKAAEAKAKALESQLRNSKSTLDVEDYIDISASLEGLDQREKSFLAEQHKLTGKPLTEIRNSEDFQLWDSAYQDKLAKEKALKPSGTQTESEKPQTLAERLRGVSLEEKEKILSEAGLYRSPRPRQDRSVIGGTNFLR